MTEALNDMMAGSSWRWNPRQSVVSLNSDSETQMRDTLLGLFMGGVDFTGIYRHCNFKNVKKRL